MTRGVTSEHKRRIEIANGFIHFVPWIETAIKVQKNMECINYLCNNQQYFINFSIEDLQGFSEQLAATSLMSWQNRMASDVFLADNGGVCSMVGDSCTFNP